MLKCNQIDSYSKEGKIMTKEEFLKTIKGQLIVSCQAVKGEPLYVEEKSIMYLMARAAKLAGTPAIRTSSVRDVVAIKEETGLPVIGLIKRQYEGFDSYITTTMKEVDELVEAKSDVIALDCCNSKRGDGKTISEFMKEVRTKYPQAILMADISTFEEAKNAQDLGFDLVSTTMSGYTKHTADKDKTKPDFELLEKCVKELNVPVICEGRIHTPEMAVEALKKGAYAVVVGGAITRPLEIAQRFIAAVNKYHE